MAAEAAEFADTHQRFWKMHDAIFENQQALSPQFLLELAQSLHLPAPDLAAALESGQFTPHVKKDFTGGVRSGVNGTPTFFINNQRHDGPFEFEDLVAAIDAQLNP